MRKVWALFFLSFLFLMQTGVEAYYLYEPFNSGSASAGWTNHFWYGRNNAIIGRGDGVGRMTSFMQSNVGNRMLMRGTIASNCDRDGTWKGLYAFNGNKFDATANQPFGFEVIREWANLDPSIAATAVGTNANDPRHQAIMGIALFRDNPASPLKKTIRVTNRANEWGGLDALFMFDERVADMGTYFKQTISYFDGMEIELDSAIKNAKGIDGRVYNISNVMLWDYRFKLAGNNNTRMTNTNRIGFRVTHDGSYISLYVNPNPYARRTDLPNEWLYLTRKQVIWNDNIQFMIGAQQKNCNWNGPAKAEGAWDNLLVRSAANASVASISPAAILVTIQTQAITLNLTNDILPKPQNAGINFIKVTKPASMKWPNATIRNITNFITVRNWYSNKASIQTLKTRWYQTNVFPLPNEVAVMSNAGDPDTFLLVLGTQITNMAVGLEHIYVDMKLIQSNQFTPPLSFTAQVQAQQFHKMTTGKSNYSTCGWQTASGAAGAQVGLQKGPSYAFASISPNSVYFGQNTYNFTYYLSTGGVSGRQNVTWAAIRIPPQFTNSTKVTNFASTLLGTNTKYLVKVTNNISGLGAGKFIRINYTSSPIPSPDGLDVLTFSVMGNVSTGTGYWKSWTDGGTSLSGTSLTNGENVNFQSKNTIILPKGPAVGFSSISPNSVFQAAQDFSFTYYLSTAGVPDGREEIATAAIEIPPQFTNAKFTNFSSVVLGTNIKHKLTIGTLSGSATNLTKRKVLLLDYAQSKIASPNGLDVISFRVINNVTVGTGSWKSWISGSSLTSLSSNTWTNSSFQSKSVVVVPNLPAECFAAVDPTLIYQGPNDYNFNYYFSTAGVLPGRQSISFAAIEIPTGFTNARLTNFNSVLMGTNEKSLVRIKRTNLFSFPTNKKYILLDYSTSKIASPDGLDVLSFRIIGNVLKGKWKWKSHVDGTSLSAVSLQSSTNAVYRTLICSVNGETPKADAELTLPSAGDPRVLFNNVSVNTLEYKIRNASATPGNNLYDSIISVPAIFTQVKVLSSSLGLSTNFIKVGRIANVSFITVHYGLGGAQILPGNIDRIKFRTIHKVSGGVTTNVLFSAVVNNSNGEGFKAVSTTGFVNAIQVTDPQPIAACKIVPTDGTVWSSDVSNRFAYTIKNTAPSGNIFYARITLPAQLFTNITSVTSGKVTLGFITVSRSNVFINYNAAGTSIAVGDQDVVTFHVMDKYTNSLPGTSLVQTRVSNLAKGNNAFDINVPDETRTVSFVPQPVRVRSYVSNNYVLTAVSTSTLYYVFNNFGDVRNKVKYAEVDFPGGGLTITSATSVFSGSWNITGGSKISRDQYGLDGGQSDVIRIILNDTINVETFRDLMPRVTMNTSTLMQTSRLPGDTNRVFFQTPPPVAKGRIAPSVLFTTSVKKTESLTYDILNDGIGQNEILTATILVPTYVQGKVRAVSSSWPSCTITNYPNRIVLAFQANPLAAKATNHVGLAFTNSVMQRTNLLFSLAVENNDGKGYYTNHSVSGLLGSGQKNIVIIPRTEAFISSPSQIEDYSTTNLLTFLIKNTNAGGLKLTRAKIAIPTAQFSVVTNSITSPWPSSVESVVGNEVIISYVANNLIAGAQDTVSFKVVDTISKASNISAWPVSVQFTTNDGFYATGTNQGKQTLKTRKSAPAASAALSRSYLYVTAMTNSVTLQLTNKGLGDNSMTAARISYPVALANIAVGAVQSAQIANDAANITYAGNSVILQYLTDGTSLLPGQVDTITIRFSDSITNITTMTLQCEVNNTDPVSPVSYIGAVGDFRMNAVLPSDAFITPTSVDTTTSTNVFTYRIVNQGKQAAVKKAVLTFPGIITSILSNGSAKIANDAGMIRLSGTSSMTLDYAGDANGDLLTTENDIVSFKAVDSRLRGQTNVLFQSYVNDGFGYAETITANGQSKTVLFSMPAAKADAFIAPFIIDYDSVSNDFVYVVSNKGKGSDHLDKIRITYPAGFVLLTNFTGKYFSSQSSIVKGAGYFDVNYFSEGSYIPAQTTETLKFRAFDNINTVGEGSWTCQIDNSSGANLQVSTIPTGKRQTVSIVVPDQSSGGRVTPNAVFSTMETNHHFSVFVRNQSGSRTGARVRIDIPLPQLKTNGLKVGSAILGPSFISRGSNFILLDYEAAGLPLAMSGGADTVQIAVRDTLTNTIASNNWQVSMQHTGSPSYKTTELLTPSDSFGLKLQLPPASAAISVSPQAIFTFETSKQLVFFVTNNGNGKNYVTELQLEVPYVFTNGMDTSKVGTARSGLGATVGYVPATRKITINYSAAMLGVGESDLVSVTVMHSRTNSTNNIPWNVSVNNGAGAVSASDLSFGSKNVSILRSSARASASLTPGNIYSTDVTNIFTYFFKNEGVAGDVIQRARIVIPPSVTGAGMWNITSLRAGSYITNKGNEIVLDYSSAGYSFGSGANDTITFTAQDAYTTGSHILDWGIKADFNLNRTNILANDLGPNAQRVFATHPPILARAELLTPFIFTSPTNTSRNIRYRVQNKGIGNNNIYRIELTLEGKYVQFLVPAVSSVPAPSGATPVTFITNVPSGTNVTIQLDYPFTPILPGQSGEISLDLQGFNLNDESYNQPVTALLRNATSGPMSVASEYGDTTLDIVYESKTVFAPSIVQDNQANLYDRTIYTINNAAEVRFQLFNKSPSYNIVESLIGFDFNKFTNITVQGTVPGMSYAFTNKDGRDFIRIMYLTNAPLAKGNFDVLRIGFAYRQTNVAVTAMTCQVRYHDGSPNFFGRYVTNEQSLVLTKAFWGQIRGTVFPVLPGKSFNMKLYHASTGQQISDVFGNSVLFTSTDTNGSYTLDYIPPGEYNVKYYDEEGEFLSDYYVKNISILSNTVSFVSQIYMKNAAVRAATPGGACIYCYDDQQQSSFCVPGETVISDFYLDIYLREISSEQIAQAKKNLSITAGDLSGLEIFRMELKDLSMKSLSGVPLKKSGKLTLAYDPALIAAKGWNVSTLAIYAWDEATKKWTRIGGKAGNGVLVATVNYLNHSYIILPSEIKESGAIHNVSASPNPFTPNSRNLAFNSVKLSFSLDDNYENVQVNIFNLKGELVQKITAIDSSGRTVQVWWDGKDQDGYPVPAGVYIYQIRAGKYKYSGSILLVE